MAGTSASELLAEQLISGAAAKSSEVRGPVLDESDRQSPTWKKIMAYYEARATKLRRDNDKNLDEVRTARLRGRIEETKHVLALDKPAPVLEADDS